MNSFNTLETQTQSLVRWEVSEQAALQGLIATISQGQGSSQGEAMNALYDATVRRVYSLVRRFAPDDASAEDVTQEVYLQAWQQAARFDAERGVAIAWLLNLARSRALDAWRKAASRPILINSEVADLASSDVADAFQPIDFLEAADQQALLYAALQALPAATRQMLSLAFFQDMSHAEISAHLTMPLGTVKSTLRRALLSLREYLQSSGLPATHLDALALEDTP